MEVLFVGTGVLKFKNIISSTNFNTTATQGSWTADKDYKKVIFSMVAGTGSFSMQITVAGVNVPLVNTIGGTGYTKGGRGAVTNEFEGIKAGNVIYARTYNADDGQGFASRVDCHVCMIYLE